MTSRPHHLKKTSGMQSKRRDLHHTWLHRETNEKLSFYCYSPRWITTTFFFLRVIPAFITLIKLWRSSSLFKADGNACRSSKEFSTIGSYLRSVVIHHHRIMYFVLCHCPVFDGRILIEAMKYTGHHNACVIKLLLKHYICTITNHQFLKCLWVHEKTFSALPKVYWHGEKLKSFTYGFACKV